MELNNSAIKQILSQQPEAIQTKEFIVPAEDNKLKEFTNIIQSSITSILQEQINPQFQSLETKLKVLEEQNQRLEKQNTRLEEILVGNQDRTEQCLSEIREKLSQPKKKSVYNFFKK